MEKKMFPIRPPEQFPDILSGPDQATFLLLAALICFGGWLLIKFIDGINKQ
jgi:hypothetical protein